MHAVYYIVHYMVKTLNIKLYNVKTQTVFDLQYQKVIQSNQL